MPFEIRELTRADFHNYRSGMETLISKPYDRTIVQYMRANPDKPRYHTTQAKVVLVDSAGNKVEICMAGGTVDSRNARIRHSSFTIPVPADLETIFTHFWQGGWSEENIRRFEYRISPG